MEVKAAVADVAGICDEAFAAVVVVSDFTVVVTAGASFAIFDTVVVAVVVVVVGSVDGGAAGDTAGGVEATGVATVVVLAESGPVVLTVVDREEFGSTATSEAAETTSVGFTPAGVDDTVLAGGDGVVAVTRVVAHVDRQTEDVVSVAGAELTTSVEKTTGEGEAAWGRVGAWSEADTCVESWFVFAAGAETSVLVSVVSALVDSES